MEEISLSGVSNRETLAADLRMLGLKKGDVVLARGALGAVGRVSGRAEAVLAALIDVIGHEGTLISLAFTETTFLRRARRDRPFTLESPTYAGALPKVMLRHPGALRSSHPACSFVAIGAHADEILNSHNANSGAYEPVRRIVALEGIGLLIGCVAASPGFTTAHLAETDLRLHRRVVFPWLNSVYYRSEAGLLRLFRRKDAGLCSMGFSRFYEHYVREGILKAGLIGQAYSITVPLASSYRIERRLLAANAKFAICDNHNCVTCNGRRWDRLHRVPGLLIRRLAGLATARLRHD